MYKETSTRSIVKALSWRGLGTIATSVIVWIFTRRLDVAVAVGGLEGLFKICMFYLHERLWDRVRIGRHQIEPVVVWLTGLSGSGKSTLAQSVSAALAQRGLRVETLDGDKIRTIFPNTGFTRQDRDAHIKRVGFLASRLEQHGVFVVCSLVSPYHESRDFVRKLCKNFVEVHVATPIEECERRDTKGLYARARRGEIKNFTGIDDPYEAPIRPEVVIDTREVGVEQATGRVLEHLKRYI